MADATTRERALVPEPLTEASWRPFGWLPVADVDPDDGKETMTFQWADAHVNLIGHARDEVPERPHGLRCEMLFRHRTHTQALMVLNCPAVVVVADPDATFSSPEDAGRLRAFRLRPLDALVLHRGTWHWGPFPVDAPRVDMLNVQGRRYAEDNDCCRLDAVGASVEVLADRPSGH